MNIVQLHLENFRNAEKIEFCHDLNFDPHMNVFYGINGAGKSTILDAIAILLSWLSARMRSLSGSGRGISMNDINNKASSSGINLRVDHAGFSFSWSIIRNRRPGRQNTERKSQLLGVGELCKMLTQSSVPLYPVLAFYPVTRAVIDIPLRIRSRHDFGALNAYENSLSSAADFRTFFEWYREREDLENETYRNNHVLVKDPQLDAVRQAVEQFLPGFSQLTVRRNPLRMEVKKNGSILLVNQLSDGEKCLLALVGDLARRLAIANEQNPKNALNGAGIVLIDEVDLHLHPAWQRMIVPTLRRTFPNCQFFLSTHSPLVLNQLQPQNLFLLKNNQNQLSVEHPGESYGKNSTRILEDLMGLATTSTDEVAEALTNIFQLIAENRITEARKKIVILRQMGFDEPELKQAEILIRRRELIAK